MELKSKIRICVVYSDTAGVGHWRSIWPHQYIQEKYGDEFDIDIMGVSSLNREDLTDFIRNYDIFVFHKMLDRECRILNMIKFMNIPVVCDIDDAFNLGPDHPLYVTSRKEKWGEVILKHLRLSDCVTTTTPLFAKRLEKINKNVVVLPNAVDADMEQFRQNKKKSDRIRFGLVCGSAHLKDIELMRGISTLPKDVMDKIQFSLCGFDTRGMITIHDPKTNQIRRRDIRPEESVWARYEEFLTNNYSTVSPEHREFLLKFIPCDDPFTNEPYRRFWTKDINVYAKHYENVDVLLAPLKENEFNHLKSELKECECAFTDTALIASYYGPYTLNLKPYIGKGGIINLNGNALLVEPSKNHKQWAKYITYVANNPDCIDIMKNNLKKDICEKYSIEKVTEDRVKLYRKLYQERHVASLQSSTVKNDFVELNNCE